MKTGIQHQAAALRGRKFIYAAWVREGSCGTGIVLPRNVKRKFKTVPKRKRPGEFSAASYADENFSPAGAL